MFYLANEIGMTYDVLALFLVRFNERSKIVDMMGRYDDSVSEYRLESWLKLLPKDLDEHLRVFFYRVNRKVTFAFGRIFLTVIDGLKDKKDCISALLNYIKTDEFIEKIKNFYLSNIPEDELQRSPWELVNEYCLIRDSKVQMSLVGFLMDPTALINKLHQALAECYEAVSRYHRERQDEKYALLESFGQEDLLKIIVEACGFKRSKFLGRRCPIGISLFLQEIMLFSDGPNVKFPWLLMGIHLESTMEHIRLDRRNVISLEILGEVFHDAQRAEILRLLHKEGGLTTKDLISKTGLSPSALNRHLTTLERCHSINAQTRQGDGKRKHYYLSRPFFEKAIEHLEQYTIENR